MMRYLHNQWRCEETLLREIVTSNEAAFQYCVSRRKLFVNG